MSELPHAWQMRADYVDEAEMALNRLENDEWPGLADNPVWREVMADFERKYRTGSRLVFK